MNGIPTPTVAGLLLAAGRSRRFGADKRQATLGDGQTVLAASVFAARQALPELWVVLRADDEPQRLGLDAGVQVVFSAAAANGMGHSLADGVAALLAHSTADAVAILLGDMPWVSPHTVGQLMAEAGAEHIVVPTFEGAPGHPVLFGRQFWPALLALEGDSGARSVLLDHSHAVRRVAVNDPGVLRDVDTPDALLGC